MQRRKFSNSVENECKNMNMRLFLYLPLITERGLKEFAKSNPSAAPLYNKSPAAIPLYHLGGKILLKKKLIRIY